MRNPELQEGAGLDWVIVLNFQREGQSCISTYSIRNSTAGKKMVCHRSSLPEKGGGLLWLWSSELSVFMWCDFRKEKDANYRGSACLRFRLRPACATLRLDRGETGTLKSNAPRWDLMRASCIKSYREKGNTPHGSRQWYTGTIRHTHCNDTFKHYREVTFPHNDFWDYISHSCG